jgi:hypothetical protein
MFLAWVPFLVFAGVFTLGMVAQVIFAKTTRVKIDGAGPARPFTSRIAWSRGMFDHKTTLIPNSLVCWFIPAPPAWTKAPPKIDFEIHLLNKTFRAASASYWTPDPPEIVWEFTAANCPAGTKT